MISTRVIFRKALISKCVLSLVIAVGFIGTSYAQPQFDAPYYEFQKKFGDEWAMEDKGIDEKLAALEKKFGKKPNIIYILTDDIGHGELGVKVAGQHAEQQRRSLTAWRKRGCCSTVFIPNLPVHQPALP